MTTLYKHKKVDVNFIGEIKLIEFHALGPELSLEDRRVAWEETIDLMKSLYLNKICINESKTNYSNIHDFLYCNEGLVQIMARAIKNPKLYCSFCVPEKLFSGVNESTKFKAEFNQYKEIEYEFFLNRDECLRWLIAKPNPKTGVISKLLNLIFKAKKTTTDEQFKSVMKEAGLIDHPLFEQMRQDDLKRKRKFGAKWKYR